MQDRTLADGSVLRLLDAGSGEAMVFVPMIAELNFVYAPQLEEFGQDHRVLVYEPRLSRTSHFGIADRAREIILLLDELTIERAHLVAWSDAGSAAYHFAKTWPDRCRSVAFLGLADEYRFPQPLHLATRLLAAVPLEQLVPDRVLARILARYLGGRQVKPQWVAQRAARVPHLARLFKHSVLPNLLEHRPSAGEVGVPSVVLCGDDDALVSIAQAQRMAQLLAGEAMIIPGGEHFLGYVHPDPVNSAMRTFYQKASGGAMSQEA